MFIIVIIVIVINDCDSTKALYLQKLDDIGMIEFSQVVDVCFLLLLDLLDGHPRASQLAPEHGSLRAGPQPLQ